MTLSELVERLGADDQALRFSAAWGALDPGYHVTELRVARKAYIDCGGRTGTEDQAELQLSGGYGRPMTTSRFAGIAKASVAALPDLAELPIVVEMPGPDGGLRLMDIGDVRGDGSSVTVALSERGAVCRPMLDMCCGQAATHPVTCCA